MKEIIVRQFINVEEPDKCGLPFVIGQFNVSCKSGENVKELVNFIYSRVFQLKHPSMHEVWFLDLKRRFIISLLLNQWITVKILIFLENL